MCARRNTALPPPPGFRFPFSADSPQGDELLMDAPDLPQECHPSAVRGPLPALRADLVIRPLGEEGRYVVKDPATGAYFRIGEQEYFLLTQLDGRQTAGQVCAAFVERFGEPLSEEELEEFLGMARAQGWLQAAGGPGMDQASTAQE